LQLLWRSASSTGGLQQLLQRCSRHLSKWGTTRSRHLLLLLLLLLLI
jgi:hypothetical protein